MTQDMLNDILSKSFYNKFRLDERRPNLYQLSVPIYHNDGDMIDLFIKTNGHDITLCDCGLTLMHLSYSFDINTKNREKLLNDIVRDGGAVNDDGNICLATSPNMLFESIMQMSQVISKISAMKALQRDVIHSLFYDEVNSYISTSLKEFKPVKNFVPIKGRDELTVDYLFETPSKPIYLFAVRGNSKAKDSVISMLSFQQEKTPFIGIVVHDDYRELSTATQKMIMNAADKQYFDFNSFTSDRSGFVDRYLN